MISQLCREDPETLENRQKREDGIKNKERQQETDRLAPVSRTLLDRQNDPRCCCLAIGASVVAMLAHIPILNDFDSDRWQVAKGNDSSVVWRF